MDENRFSSSPTRVVIVRDIIVGLLTSNSTAKWRDVFWWEECFGVTWHLLNNPDRPGFQLITDPDVILAVDKKVWPMIEELLLNEPNLSLHRLNEIRATYSICWLNKVQQIEQRLSDAISQGVLMSEIESIIAKNKN